MTKEVREYDIFLTRIENLEKTIEELKRHIHINKTGKPVLENES